MEVGDGQENGVVLAAFGGDAEIADEDVAFYETLVVVILAGAGIVAVAPAVVAFVVAVPFVSIIVKINAAIAAEDAGEVAVVVQLAEVGHAVFFVSGGWLLVVHSGAFGCCAAIVCSVPAPESKPHLINRAGVLLHDVFEVEGVALPSTGAGLGVEVAERDFFLQNDFADALQFVVALEFVHLQILENVGVVNFEHLHIYGAEPNCFKWKNDAAVRILGNDRTAPDEADGGFQILKNERPIAALFHGSPRHVFDTRFHPQVFFSNNARTGVGAHKIAIHREGQIARVIVEANEAVQILRGCDGVGKIEQNVRRFFMHDDGTEHDELVQRGHHHFHVALFVHANRLARP